MPALPSSESNPPPHSCMRSGPQSRLRPRRERHSKPPSRYPPASRNNPASRRPSRPPAPRRLPARTPRTPALHNPPEPGPRPSTVPPSCRRSARRRSPWPRSPLRTEQLRPRRRSPMPSVPGALSPARSTNPPTSRQSPRSHTPTPFARPHGCHRRAACIGQTTQSASNPCCSISPTPIPEYCRASRRRNRSVAMCHTSRAASANRSGPPRSSAGYYRSMRPAFPLSPGRSLRTPSPKHQIAPLGPRSETLCTCPCSNRTPHSPPRPGRSPETMPAGC